MLKNLFSPRLLKKVQMSFDRLRIPSAVEGQGGTPKAGVPTAGGSPQMGLFQQHAR
jgi:hypothetical protein